MGPDYKTCNIRQGIGDWCITISVLRKKVVLSCLSTKGSRGIAVVEVVEASGSIIVNNFFFE